LTHHAAHTARRAAIRRAIVARHVGGARRSHIDFNFSFQFPKMPTRLRGCCLAASTRFVSHCAIERRSRYVWKSKSIVRKSMSEQSQSASNRGGVRPGAGRPEGSVGPRRARILRRRVLIKAYSDALGGDARLTEGQRADIRKAAELVALAEDCRALAMQEGAPGGPGALSALVRLESASARAVRVLRLPEPGRAVPSQTVAEYWAGRHAAPEEAEE
jgi:hypothetical protein